MNIKIKKNTWTEKYNRLPLQVKASFWFLLCSFLQRGISTITTPIFTRLLTTSDYGKFSVFNSWLSAVTIFVTLNLFAGMYARGLVKFSKDRSVFISSMQGLMLTLNCIWLVVYLIFREFWNALFDLSTVQMMAMFALIWSSAVFSLWSMEQRTEVKYKRLLILTIFVSIVKPLVGIIFVYCAEDKVTARIVSMAIINMVVFSYLAIIQWKKGKVFYSKKYWKHALLFCIPLVPHYLSLTILSSMDKIMIEKMVGPSEAGIYSLAYSIALLMAMFNGSLMSTLEPWMYKKINEGNTLELPNIIYPALIGIAVVNLGLIAFAPEIVSIFAPREYYDAIWIIPPVAMSSFFSFMYPIFGVFQFHFEKTKLITCATIIGAILNVSLNYIFIGKYGYYAAGYTTLVCYIIFSLAHYLLMRRMCKQYFERRYPYKTKYILSISCLFMMLGFIYLVLYIHILVRYAFTASLFVLLIIKRNYIIVNIKKVLGVKGEK